VGQLFAPAEAASIPTLVGSKQISAATSLFTVTIVVTIVLSVPLASIAQRFLGLEGPYYFGAALFMVASGAIWLIKPRLAAAKKEPGAEAPGVVREIKEALQVIRRSPILPFAFGMLTLSLVIVFTIFALSAGYMQHVLLSRPQNSYILLIPATVGMVLTGTLVSRRSSAAAGERTVAMGLALAGAAMLVLGVLPLILSGAHMVGYLIPLAILLALLFGVGLGAVLIPSLVLIQEATEEATRGRIFGGAFLAINLAIALPLLVAGAVADLVGASAVIGFLGVLLIAIGLISWRLGWGSGGGVGPSASVTAA
jgi:predicted MFS family arabinose efflux permease